MRLNKYIASCGICSRREADKLIEEKRITIGGVVAECGAQVDEGDIVCLDGKEIRPKTEKIVLAYYKPVGVVCTENDVHAEKTVIEDLGYKERVTYAGRLDKDSEGLLIMTDDGELIDRMMRARNGHEKEYEVTLKNEGKGSIGYFLAGNPFICGLDMQKFFEKNSTVIQPYFLVMKDSELDPKNPDLNPSGSSWKWTDVSFAAYDGGSGLQGQTIVPPRYGFFVKSIGDEVDEIKLKYTVDMMAHTPRTASSSPDGLHYRRFTIQAERDGNQSEATVIKSDAASNKFLPEEDLATFIVSDISSSIPVVYTLTGRLATSINRLHDFLVLPIGIESNSDEHATVTFQGVESLGDSLMLYDAKIDEAVPIYSGMSTRMPGRTQNRFFIVQASSIQRAIAESSLQIYGENGIVVVTSTTGQPITEVEVFDVGGRRVYSAKPDFSEHRFRMPKGVYVVSAKTADLKQVKKFSY